MVTDWLREENLQPFLTVLGWIVGYNTSLDDWTAVNFGVRDTNAESDRWYSYEFIGKHRAAFSLALDPGTSIVHLRAEVPTELEPQVGLAVSIFSHFRVEK